MDLLARGSRRSTMSGASFPLTGWLLPDILLSPPVIGRRQEGDRPATGASHAAIFRLEHHIP